MKMHNNKFFEWILAIILMCFVVGLVFEELSYSPYTYTLEA